MEEEPLFKTKTGKDMKPNGITRRGVPTSRKAKNWGTLSFEPDFCAASANCLISGRSSPFSATYSLWR